MAESPPPPRRFLTWRTAAAAVAIAVLLWGASALLIGWLADARWAAMKGEYQRLLEEARARERTRPALRGEPSAGNAWDDYSAAIREVRTLYELESSAAKNFLESGSGADRVLVEKVLARHASIIETVRRGASRTDASLSLEWKEGALLVPSRFGTAIIARLAVCQARFLAERGRPREAIELLVDSCRFVGDLDHVEDLEPEFRELNSMIESGMLGRPDLEQLDRELEILDRGFPHRGHRVFLDFVTLGSLFLKTGGSVTPQLVGLGVDPEDYLWRFGFSGRLMKTNAFAVTLAAVRQLIDADDRPWMESRDLMQRLTAELGASKNPIARIAPEEVLRSDLAHRGHRAQLRLIRTAARYRATGELLELPDPFGEKLKNRLADDGLKIWSVGPEGKDHGGVGTFSIDGDGQDLLLEVRR
jgi:hypothetical protein